MFFLGTGFLEVSGRSDDPPGKSLMIWIQVRDVHAEHERLAANERNQQVRQEDEDLLAKVDSDVSRGVPSAMEPLAQMMAGDETQ